MRPAGTPVFAGHENHESLSATMSHHDANIRHTKV